MTQEIHEGLKIDIGMLSVEGDHTRKMLLEEDYIEAHPHVSPDGRWLAYTSNESGRDEIYVRPFPDVEKGKWQVSTNTGNSPIWSPDGRALYYLTGQSTTDSAMKVAVETQPTFKSGKPEILFRGSYVGFYPSDFPWDIHPDGKRFLMMKEAGTNTSDAGSPQKINVVMNWIDELKQRVPVK